jgi:hypothetical protein
MSERHDGPLGTYVPHIEMCDIDSPTDANGRFYTVELDIVGAPTGSALFKKYIFEVISGTNTGGVYQKLFAKIFLSN